MNAAKGSSEPLGRAVHDIRNPLAVLRATLGWLETQLAGIASVPGDVLDAIRDCTMATLQLVRIVDDLSLLVVLDDPAAPGRVPVVLGPIVDVAAAAAASDAARQATVAVMPRAFDESLFVTIGDVVQLSRAIEACALAVVRAANPGTRVEISADIVTSGIEIVFAASGDVGPFTEHDSLAGSGLALHVASRIVTAHGGSLQVMSGARAPRIVLTLA